MKIMRFKGILSVLTLAITLAAYADGKLLSGYRGYAQKQIVFATGFEGRDVPQLTAPCYQAVAGAGVNGSTGLKLTRSSSEEYLLEEIPLPHLNKDQVYILKLMVRGTNLSRKGPVAFAEVEFTENGRYITSSAICKPVETDFTEYSIEFVPPPNATKSSLVLYLQRGVTGTLYYDNLEIVNSGRYYPVLLTWPSMGTIRPDDHFFRLQVDENTPSKFQVLATIINAGVETTQLLNMTDHFRFLGKWSKLVPGPVKLNVKLLDPVEKTILNDATFNLNAVDSDAVPAASCLIDKYGRAIVDGKPFMPIGVYEAFREEDFRRLADAGFNCIMNYRTLNRCLGSCALSDSEREKKITEFMDLLAKHRLKLIFSLKDQLPHHNGPDVLEKWADASGRLAVAEKAVNTFKNHPALLAWYISDEEVRRAVPDVLRLRELINHADPNHPTCTLTCNFGDLPYYGISGDIIAVDCYPIKSTNPRQSIKTWEDALHAGERTGLPCWAVSQMFNWAVDGKDWSPDMWSKTRGPNAEEMRAMPLLAAIRGARGFIFYAYAKLIDANERVMPGAGVKEWNQKVVPMVKVLRELEPFIMSIAPAPQIRIKSVPENAVRARAFTDGEGNLRIIVVGTGAPCRALITIPDKRPLQSQFGKTKALGNGQYEFCADGIASDILHN